MKIRGKMPKLKATTARKGPAKCAICAAEFNRPAKLREHQLVAHQNHRHMCDQCGKGFASSDNLRRHTKGRCPGEKLIPALVRMWNSRGGRQIRPAVVPPPDRDAYVPPADDSESSESSSDE